MHKNISSKIESMCDCLTASNFPTNFTNGAKYTCIVECNTVTQLLVGGEDPDYKAKIAQSMKYPIEFLGKLVSNFPKSDVGDGNCTFTTGLNAFGFYHVLTKCDFIGNAAKLEEECKKMYDYLNPKNFLDKTTTNKCVRQGNQLNLDIVAKNK